MANQAISVTKKKGRPKGPPTAVVRLPTTTIVDAVRWAAKQDEPMTPSDAIRRLVEKGLKD